MKMQHGYRNMKKITLIILAVLTALLFLVEAYMSSVNSLLCGEPRSFTCLDFIGDVWLASLIFVPVFFFSLTTYFLRDEIFHTWIRFTTLWVLFSFIVIFASTDHSGGLLGISDQEAFGIITWVLYILISFIIIGWKYGVTRLAK